MKKFIIFLILVIVGLTSFIIQGFLIKPNNQKLLSNTPQIIYKTKIIYKKIPLDSSQIIVNKPLYKTLIKTAFDVNDLVKDCKFTKSHFTYIKGAWSDQSIVDGMCANEINLRNIINTNKNNLY